MDIISNAIIQKYKYWRTFGIYTWNDLMKQTFGKVNAEHHIYDGIEGLQNAQQEMLEFERINNRIPNSQDKEMKPYFNAALRGIWKDLGIHSWNDLMKQTFGKVNVRKKLWIGEEGFERAQATLNKYYEKNGKLPTRRSQGMGGITKAIQRGHWLEFGINYWNDLLDKASYQKKLL